MFLGAAPVSAGTLSYTAEKLPTDAIGGIIPVAAGPLAGAVVNDIAVSTDGNTIYAATNVGGAKSINAGRTWTALNTGLVATDMVAIAPDKPNFVAFADATLLTVAVSQNGGNLFSALGAVRDTANGNPATVINDIDVSPTVSGINYIAVAGQDTLGPVSELYFFNMGAPIANWAGALTDIGTTAVRPPGAVATNLMAVAFSPNFASDYMALAVEDDNTTTTDFLLHAYSFNSFDFNDSTYAAYPVILDAATVGAMVKADIAIAPTYYGGEESTRVAFVSVDGAALDDAVYRTDDAIPSALAGAVAMYSIAYNGTTLVGGAAASNIVYTNATPLSPFGVFVPNRTVKRSGGNLAGITNVSVAWSGANVVSANQAATNAAFSMSTDNGLTFNDISLVDMAAFNINDFAVAADGVKRYVVADDGVDYSVFYYDGTYWQRTRTIAPAAGFVGPYVAGVSPTNFDILYLVDTGSRSILYTNNAGKSNWLPRTCPNAPAGAFPVDLAVEADNVIYVATSNGAAGAVIRSATSGFTWGLALTPTAMVDVASISLVAVNSVVAGGTAGEVAYTTDGGVTWVPTAGIVAGGAIYAAAADLATGSNIYAVTTLDADVYTWTIGTSLLWTSPGLVFGAPFAVGTAADLSTGITLINGTLYRIGANPGVDTEISRSLDPFFGAFATWANTQAAATVGATTANVAPDVIKVSGGYQLWFTDITGGVPAVNRILTFTDALAPATAIPAITAPADGALVQVNNLTGVAYQTTISWNASSLATAYAVDIALDSAFTNRVVAAGAVVFPAVIPGLPVNVIIGPGALAPFNIAFQPGQKYYWRVRATAPFFSGYTPTFTFIIMPGQAMVAALSAPENGTEINSTNPSFSWTPLGGIATYDFQLDTGTTFAAPLYAVTATGGGVDLPASIVLERGRTYFWRVRALTPTLGDWSTIGNFSVAELVTTSATTTIATTITTNVTNTTITLPQPTSTVITIPGVTQTTQTVNPTYIWAIIIIGAVLVLAVIVLIVRTRRSV